MLKPSSERESVWGFGRTCSSQRRMETTPVHNDIDLDKELLHERICVVSSTTRSTLRSKDNDHQGAKPAKCKCWRRS